MAGPLTRRINNECGVANPFDRIFESFFREPVFTRELAPVFEEGILAVDVSEDAESVIVRASLPGVKKDDVNVEVHDGVVTISAHKTEEHEETQEKFYRKERREGSVSRRIALPVAVLEDKASAELKDGELTLRLPKTKQGGPRKVSVG
ncbi:MAG: Hsp20/alpha crystallin family protein [Phycisphaerales bacterium]